MNRIKFYLDEDLQSQALTIGLRARAVDILTTSEAEQNEADDNAQLLFATRASRVVLTSNVVDFPRIHAALPAEAMRNRIEYLSDWRVRPPTRALD